MMGAHLEQRGSLMRFHAKMVGSSLYLRSIPVSCMHEQDMGSRLVMGGPANTCMQVCRW